MSVVTLSSIQTDLLQITTWVTGLQKFNLIMKEITALQFTLSDYTSIPGIKFSPTQSSPANILAYSLPPTSYNMINITPFIPISATSATSTTSSTNGFLPMSFMSPLINTSAISQGVYDIMQYIPQFQVALDTYMSSAAYTNFIAAAKIISLMSTVSGSPDFSQLIILYLNCGTNGNLATPNMQLFYSLMTDLIMICSYICNITSFSLDNDYLYLASIIPIAMD